ncbi:type II toxin-antitoxin system RelE/ParE family toxin [Bradyrhizobium sp. 18BD]
MILLSPAALDDMERLRSFLDAVSPDTTTRALRLIWKAIDRLSEIPSLGKPAEEDGIRQIVIRFGSSGYVIVAETGDILITRLWHGREERT